MNRRKFLKMSSAATATLVAGSVGLLSWTPRAYAATVSVKISAVKGDVAMIDGTAAFVFSFSTGSNAVLPGPTIVCQAGDTVVLTLANTLATPVAFNLGRAGVRVVAGAKKTVQISFAAPSPGTYLFYDDQNNGVNRVLGLSGTLVVMPLGVKNQSFVNGPTFVRQYKWLLGNVDPVWGSLVAANGDAYVSSIKPSTFQPRYFLINGESFSATDEPNTALAGLVGDTTLVRILNGGGMVHSPHFHGNHVQIVSVNGVNATGTLKQKDIVSMFPCDVRDVIYPFTTPPDAWPPIGSAAATSPLNQFPQVYPMHCHSEMSQTAGGGLYPHGLHCAITIGEAPAEEPALTTAVAALPA